MLTVGKGVVCLPERVFCQTTARCRHATHNLGQSDGGIPVGGDERHGPDEPCRCLRYTISVLFNSEVLTVYVQVLERFFSKKERANLFRSWVGSASMWVKVAGLCR